MQAAVAVGMAQGELQGNISNLQTIMRILGPLVWGQIYSWGQARGRSELFYYPVALGLLIEMGICIHANLDQIHRGGNKEQPGLCARCRQRSGKNSK